MGDCEFWPLTESKPMSRLQQNSAQLITSARGPPKLNLVQIQPLAGYYYLIRFIECKHWRSLLYWMSRSYYQTVPQCSKHCMQCSVIVSAVHFKECSWWACSFFRNSGHRTPRTLVQHRPESLEQILSLLLTVP